MDVLTPAALGDMPRPGLFLADCRHVLGDPDAGRRAFSAGHLAGAVHLHLDEDLSGPLRPDRLGGRHPLPDPERFGARLRALGLSAGDPVVAWDDCGGPFAARLWFLLRWLGHPDVRVLTGDATSLLVETGPPRPRPPGDWQPDPQPGWIASHEEVRQRSQSGGLIVDCRAPERYRGEVEPLDPVAGHIPGAVNHPWTDLLQDGAIVHSPRVQHPDPVFSCGSGVTACVSLLAHRGVSGTGRLYVDSWSGWLAREHR